ncbi:MAG: PDZ domain-containing protein [Myxococcales bacterium]|nr:PDZ domain-containing protein [Myxococcales bacterium]
MKRTRRPQGFLFALAAATLLIAGGGALGCDGGGGSVAVPSANLAKGGVYVAYNHKFKECSAGCDQLQKGDLILEANGSPVSTRADLRASVLLTGQPVKLKVFRPSNQQTLDVTFTSTPSAGLPPIPDAPPLFLVGAANLDKAPDWARRNLFGHASPSIMLSNANGGILDGRQLFGSKHMLVFWDWGTREEQAQAVEILKVLQLAQGDLKAANVNLLFTHITFPSNNRQAAMNDGQLRDFQAQNGDASKPPLPLFRFPNATEYNAAREIGLEGATPYIQYLRSPPAIVLLDEGGIVRWHSEGIQPLPAGSPIPTPTQYTIIEAIKFAQEKL